MFKNYITIALRTLWKNKLFTSINVLGLAIGISASLVIYLLVNYHFTFDKFEKDGDRIYRVVTDFNFSGEVYRNSGITSPMGPAVARELTGLDAVVPFRTWNGSPKITRSPLGSNDTAAFKNQNGVVFADEGFMRLLGYQWVAGSAQTSLLKPYQTVLTMAAAARYFPKLAITDVVGKTLYFDDTVRTTVAGIVQDIKANTDFTFTTFISKITLEKTSLKPSDWDQWSNTNSVSQLMVKLSPGTSVAAIEKGIDKLYGKYNVKDKDDKSTANFHLQPLSDIHFNAEYGGYDLPLANKATLYSLLAVALFLLLLGCINFINLTTAHATQRAKEIGIRKTMGSSRSQLILQFLSETFLLTLTATLLSIVLTPLILKAFSGFIPDGLHFNIIEQPDIMVFLFVLMLLVTFLSGFYPSLVLSGYKPVLVLKNQAFNNTSKTRNAWMRKSLTVSQFVIAQVFIMAAILVSKQISYSINKDLGYKKEAILYMRTNYYDTVKSNKYAFLNKLRAIPEVAMVSLSNNPPAANGGWSGTLKYKDGKKEIETDVQQKYGDTNYIKLYGLKILAGANITQSDTVKAFIINETYAHTLGFQNLQQAIGKNLDWSGKQIPIAGVVSDFNQKSLREPIKPLIIGSWDNPERTVNIALQPKNADGSNWKTAIAKIEIAWKEIYPKDDFSYTFFDQDIANFYEAEQNMSALLFWATGLAIFISCLGLLGLVIYTTTQRTKEIGIRKVLGASISQIVTMISKDFIVLVVMAFLISAPLAWMGMSMWLENFAYRTDISWWIFLLGGIAMILIALITLAFQTIKAAIANPVNSLRTE